MSKHTTSTAQEVHALLLDAHPEARDANFKKAANLASKGHAPQETLTAIQNLQDALADGADAAKAESLLRHATSLALKWAEQAEQ